MHNILTDPIIRIVTTAGEERVTLPGLYAALMADRVTSLIALRPHQRHALHAFLVQTGALALLTANTIAVPNAEDQWRTLLRRLTGGFSADEPWTLLVNDLSKPALLQPPTIETGLQSIAKAQRTPDSIDMLPTARNHDLKAARMSGDEPDAWLMALLTVQTMDGYGGGGGVLGGISRMNSGSGSRPCVGIAPKGRWGARVKRDIARLITKRAQILTDNPIYPPTGGLGLVWLEPWNEVNPITPDKLDLYYVEICRRIRLVCVSGMIAARMPAGKMGTRIAPPERGLTGDPWAPASKKDGFKLLTITGSGWDYKRVADILDPERFKAAPLQMWEPEDGTDASLILMGMARGSSTTDGYHERVIPIPARVLRLFGGTGDRLGTVCRERVQQASVMRDKVLKPALYTLAQAAPAKIDFDSSQSAKSADPILRAFDREVDRTFFPRLFDELTETGAAARDQRQQWIGELFAMAEALLRLAEASTPMPQARRHKILAADRGRLAGAYHGIFGKAKAEA